MLEAIMFLTGAILFLVTVIFFIYVFQERIKVLAHADRVEKAEREVRVRIVELDIQEHELQVLHDSLAFEHKQLEQAREELRMLTASRIPMSYQGEIHADASAARDNQDLSSPRDKNITFSKEKGKLN